MTAVSNGRAIAPDDYEIVHKYESGTLTLSLYPLELWPNKLDDRDDILVTADFSRADGGGGYTAEFDESDIADLHTLFWDEPRLIIGFMKEDPAISITADKMIVRFSDTHLWRPYTFDLKLKARPQTDAEKIVALRNVVTSLLAYTVARDIGEPARHESLAELVRQADADIGACLAFDHIKACCVSSGPLFAAMADGLDYDPNDSWIVDSLHELVARLNARDNAWMIERVADLCARCGGVSGELMPQVLAAIDARVAEGEMTSTYQPDLIADIMALGEMRRRLSNVDCVPMRSDGESRSAESPKLE